METIITSAGNDTVKHVKKLLTSAKARREANTYVAEGIHLVKSFLGAGGVPLMYACSQAASGNPEIAELQGILRSTDAKSAIVADSLFESITSLHATVGILILFSPPKPETQAVPIKESAVLLEDIQDPGNMGTILRTTAAVGIKNVFLSSGCASPWSPKALRAGMGAQFGLTIREDTEPARIVDETAIPVYATALTAGSVSLYEADLSGPVVWVFGNEGQGVSEALLKSGTAVTIPQANSPVESLNVAAAAAVCLYEQYRQRTT